ncbi:MAG: hypothetical protein ACLFTI_05070 [Anaerolineales bacterium]
MININALEDAVKSLAQSLQAATVFPAGLFVLINAYFIVPTFYPDLDCSTPQVITIIISLTLMLSYIFYAFNFPLIRVFEGYKFKNWSFFLWLHSCEKDRRAKMASDGWERKRDFPSRGEILSTKIGNAIAAFEEYPETHYSMNAIALWPRLVPVLEDKEFLKYVTQEKAVFDFLLNTWVVTAMIGIELAYRSVFLWQFLPALAILAATGIACFFIYEGMYIAARQWGTVVRVAFDRHRHDLAQSLYLRPAKSFFEERRRWDAISDFYLFGRPTVNAHFIPQSNLRQFKEILLETKKDEPQANQ